MSLYIIQTLSMTENVMLALCSYILFSSLLMIESVMPIHVYIIQHFVLIDTDYNLLQLHWETEIMKMTFLDYIEL
jgi:hypothetical protein